MLADLFDAMLLAITLLLLPGFYAYSPTSLSVKLQSVAVLVAFANYRFNSAMTLSAYSSLKAVIFETPIKATILALAIGFPLQYLQQKFRYARLNAIKMKYGFTDDPESYMDMTVEQAQEIEANLAEWEFPRLWQFAWVSDFVRTATDPGVSRALVKSGHMVNEDPMIEHERLQATIHLMSGFLAYKIKTPYHSLVVSRINEHHHRYGSWINSDDILYLIIHLGFNPVTWTNRFGYRKLEPFEVQANWILWREIGVRMGVKYMPMTIAQATEWRINFEKKCRWVEEDNWTAGMAMFNEIIYSVPESFKPFTRKLVASVLDWDIVHFCCLERLHPSPVLRSIAFDFFSLCGWWIRNFGFPRLSPYKRVPDAPNEKTGRMGFLHTPYDTLPFYQEANFWNLWGFGAIIRRIRGFPLPGPEFHNGTTIEAMGLTQDNAATQVIVEQKVRDKAAIMTDAPIGFRPAVGYQYGRLLPAVAGPEYGSSINKFTENTPIIPCGPDRFQKRYERRAPGFTKIDAIQKPEDVLHFDIHEAYGVKVKVNGIHSSPPDFSHDVNTTT